MKRWLCLLMLSSCTFQVMAQSRIFGSITDAITNQPLSASIVFKRKGNPSTIFQSKANGQYNVSLPENSDSMIVEQTGYRTFGILINQQSLTSENLQLDIRLVPKDKQKNNQVYQQSEQQHTVLNTKSKDKGEQVFVFQAVDALTNEALSAEFLLISTATGTHTNYSTTKKKNSFDVIFTRRDIVAVEVEAENYQKYRGNLIIDVLNTEPKKNIVRLVKAESALNLIVTGVDDKDKDRLRCELIDPTSQKKIQLKQIEKDRFSCVIKDKMTYQVHVFLGNELVHQENYVAKKGLNTHYLKITGLQNPPLTESLNLSSASDKITIYFEQSLPDLRPDAKIVLDQIAVSLLVNKDLKIELTGHTDNVGKFDLNMALSEYRAKITKSYLLEKGIHEDRIRWTPKGSTTPVAPNDTEENKQKNRRVEIVIQ